MYTYNERIIRAGRSWTDANGTKHPANWTRWTDAEKTAMGLVWADDPIKYDSQFYFASGTPRAIDDVTETVDGEEITTSGLKTNAIAQVKVTAGSLLAPTDWMVVKASEVSDYSVDQATLDYRAAVRTASNDIEAAITACTTHDAFMALHDTPVDAEGNATGNAPINDWPEEI
jgi:hypothetical protein